MNGCACEACATAVEGKFGLDWPAQLTPQQLGFVKVFVTARGKIKDLEQALGISYPTVVSRLDDVVARLEAPPAKPEGQWRMKLLERLFAGVQGPFCGYGAATPDLQNPGVDWRGTNTYIQRDGINHDFGIFDTPDAFYAAHGINLKGPKRWI